MVTTTTNRSAINGNTSQRLAAATTDEQAQSFSSFHEESKNYFHIIKIPTFRSAEDTIESYLPGGMNHCTQPCSSLQKPIKQASTTRDTRVSVEVHQDVIFEELLLGMDNIRSIEEEVHGLSSDFDALLKSVRSMDQISNE